MKHAAVTVALSAVLAAGAATAQLDFSDVEVIATPIRDGLYLVTGRGGNIVASTGRDGTFLVDDQYAPLTERIQAALDAVTDQPVRFVINTHWHGDHVGGNENLAEAGAVIIAHENVRRRMSSDQFMAIFNHTVPAAPPRALPVVTFTAGVSLHLNGDDVRIVHVARAHTDGDALVYFERANVLHMGDVWFNGMYPFIDLGSGGGIHGMVAAVERALELADEDTVIVPGHGPIGNRAELAAYAGMLAELRDRIAGLKAAGRTRDEVIAARPTARYDEQFGGGFISLERLAGFIYDSLQCALM
jgi:cyclase